jgi:hypothetical protein
MLYDKSKGSARQQREKPPDNWPEPMSDDAYHGLVASSCD